MICPTCGHSMEAEGVRWLKDLRLLLWPEGHVQFSKTEAKFFDLIWRNYHLAGPALTERVYSDRSDGGPLSSSLCGVLIHRMRRRMREASAPVKIVSHTGSSEGYHITQVVA